MLEAFDPLNGIPMVLAVHDDTQLAKSLTPKTSNYLTEQEAKIGSPRAQWLSGVIDTQALPSILPSARLPQVSTLSHNGSHSSRHHVLRAERSRQIEGCVLQALSFTLILFHG